MSFLGTDTPHTCKWVFCVEQLFPPPWGPILLSYGVSLCLTGCLGWVRHHDLPVISLLRQPPLMALSRAEQWCHFPLQLDGFFSMQNKMPKILVFLLSLLKWLLPSCVFLFFYSSYKNCIWQALLMEWPCTKDAAHWWNKKSGPRPQCSKELALSVDPWSIICLLILLYEWKARCFFLFLH